MHATPSSVLHRRRRPPGTIPHTFEPTLSNPPSLTKPTIETHLFETYPTLFNLPF